MLNENDCRRREYNLTMVEHDTVFIPIDSTRTDDSLCNRDREHPYIRQMDENHDPFVIPIFRYKFTQEFMDHLYEFSKIHQYDDRHVFKESWTEWVDANQSIIDNEIHRLNLLEYNGDILDKMFKSARYYFRKKSTEKSEPIERRAYIGINPELLESMDSHISYKITDDDFKPSESFIDFCGENKEQIKNEIIRMLANNISDNLIQEKIKKTYKNRYFMFINKKKNNSKE